MIIKTAMKWIMIFVSFIKVWVLLFSTFVGSLVLVGGDPGVGKSTLLLQVSIELISIFCISFLTNMFICLINLCACSLTILHPNIFWNLLCLRSGELLIVFFLNMKLAAIIAEGNNFNGPAPVIYISGEEVRFNLDFSN